MKGLILEHEGYLLESGQLVCPECANEVWHQPGDRPGLLTDPALDRCERCGRPLYRTDIRGLAIILNGRPYGAAKRLAAELEIPVATVRDWFSGRRKPRAPARKLLRDLGLKLGITLKF